MSPTVTASFPSGYYRLKPDRSTAGGVVSAAAYTFPVVSGIIANTIRMASNIDMILFSWRNLL